MIMEQMIFVSNLALDIKPFVHHQMPLEYTHLCPVNAYARWLDVSGITEGYLFRKLDKNDRVTEENVPMVCIGS